MFGTDPKPSSRIDLRNLTRRNLRTADTSKPVDPVPVPELEPHEAEFKDTPAFRVLSHLGCLDLTADPSGKTVKDNKRYIRATLPDGEGGVEREGVYRIDTISNTRVSMSRVAMVDGKKQVVSSDFGPVEWDFWSHRVFKLATKEEFNKGTNT